MKIKRKTSILKTMIQFLLITLSFFIFSSFDKVENVSLKDLEVKGNISYLNKKIFTGKAIGWYNNTKKKHKKYEFDYKNGKLHGKAINWYENGNKKQEGYLKDDKPIGNYTMWYENGNKKEKGKYKNGKLDAKLTRWSKDGKEIEISFFKDGKPIKK